MSADPFVGEIIPVPFNFAPTGWASCNGQLMAISQNTALFSLLGTMYGGDGKSTFALPNLNGRVPIAAGQGQGLTDRSIGEDGGTATVTLTEAEIPAHQHTLQAGGEQTSTRPGGLAPSTGGYYGQSGGGQAAPTEPVGGMPHENMQPYLTVHYIIALQGIFPQRP